MRINFVPLFFVLSGLAACDTVKVDGVCCVTDAQCAAIKVDEERPCDVGQACRDNLCVASECATSAECSDPAKPVCSLGLCEANCQVDQDCADVAGRNVCASDGVCVGCEDASQCTTAEAAQCDAETRSCRGCEQDSECVGGVCLEADGVCVADDDVIFVSDPGPIAGPCTRAAPCSDLATALTLVTPTRRAVKILSGTLNLSSTVPVSGKVYIDGSNTTVVGILGMVVLDINGTAEVTLAGLKLSGDVAVRGLNALARIFDVESTGLTTIDTGTLEVARSSFSNTLSSRSLRCTNATAVVRESGFTSARIEAANCRISLLKNRVVAEGDFGFSSNGGQVTLENNIFVARGALDDIVFLGTAGVGSVVRFNTFFNTTTQPSDGAALCANSAVLVTSNVFAYNSMHPLGSAGCAASAAFSVFDSTALAEQTVGSGNKVGEAGSFFIDRVALDLHLAPASPARGAADPTQVLSEDHDGNPRPQPSPSVADSGAFEAP